MKTTSTNLPDQGLVIQDNSTNQIIAKWLFGLCGMVFFMVILGGLTRLTHSGLSMVDWRPITGWLPPIGSEEWESVFDQYKESPEFKKINDGITIEGFKSIFWLEYFHRLWGRIMGVSLILPFIFFLAKGWINRKLIFRIIIIFLMGAFQGVLGWYMVKSGLMDNPDVSQYRLTAHLSAAIIIYGYMFWVAMSLIKSENDVLIFASPRLLSFSVFTAFWIFLTIISGGFVAGLDAGLTYNTFPLMDGQVVPGGMWDLDPWHRNFFENITTVQFDHRILAESSLVLVVGVWLMSRKANIPNFARVPFTAMLIMVLIQVALGIITLISVVPIFIALLHQIGALILFTISLWAIHTLIDHTGKF
ncbi:MAG: COX15/CtaA family protein [Pseudomonadota bacterium]|nr:COX15/CtaA family protein [Pseudomonadota bacterium]